MNKSIFAVGGDLRLSYAAAEFEKNGFNVYGYALGQSAGQECSCILEGMEKSDIILLPVPATSDGVNLTAPFFKGKISLLEIAKAAGSDKIIFGGKIPEGIFSGKVIDYANREAFAMLNAVPTAEGAIEIAMHECPFTVAGSRALVVGFGRIGKITCKMLSGIGAHVCATARRECDLSLIKAMGYDCRESREIEDIIADFDIIINTVPYKIIGREALLKMKNDAVIIDTASKPGGVDMNAAGECGVKVIWALSLPGKVAPKTSGKIICDTVLAVLKDVGV